MGKKECEWEHVDRSVEDNGCGCEDAEDSRFGCGCDEYPDTSLLDNPDKPEFMASPNFIEEFERYAYSMGY